MKRYLTHIKPSFVPIFFGTILLCCHSCNYFQQQDQDGVVAEVEGWQLTQTALDQVTANATTKEDSAAIAEQYIRQWASEILLYEEAKDRPDSRLENLVEDYRHSLYVHEYEQQLVTRKMSHLIPDTTILQFFHQHPDRFILHENIVKGVFLIYPVDAPHQEELRQWLIDLTNDENIESIEKFAYQYATGYEWFTDEWKTANQILLRLPIQTDILQQQLQSRNSYVELTDSVSTYLLQITDKRLMGDAMPLEYATPEIKRIILSMRQVEFLRQARQKLYDDAVRHGKIKLYTKEKR